MPTAVAQSVSGSNAQYTSNASVTTANMQKLRRGAAVRRARPCCMVGRASEWWRQRACRCSGSAPFAGIPARCGARARASPARAGRRGVGGAVMQARAER